MDLINSKPASKRKLIIKLILVGMALAYFVLFSFPNLVGARDQAMVVMLQPDEGTPLPYVLDMIRPAQGFEQALRSFIFYDYYYYGFPFYGPSAAVILPLQWLGLIANTTLVMYLLRQMTSLLPMVLALLVLVHLQDGFRSYRSPVLFAFLLLIPAVTQNNLWWHPDGMTFLFVALTIFFLQRDDLRLGRNFLIAGVMCGIAIATKVMGIYFFLAFLLVLLLARFHRKLPWKKVIGAAVATIMIMALAFVISNPFLLSSWARTSYINIFNKEAFLLSEGYGVSYGRGLLAALPEMQISFGNGIFLLLSLGVLIWGIWHGQNRLLHALILAWFTPVTVFLLTATHFKFQYWLPAALPLLSSLVLLLPEEIKTSSTQLVGEKFGWRFIVNSITLLFVAIQAIFFFKQDLFLYNSALNQEKDNPRIEFYSLAHDVLLPIANKPISVLHDVRFYVPDSSDWNNEDTFGAINYTSITEENYDALLILRQRLRDFLDPEATGTDPIEFALIQQFYRDVESGSVKGYELAYQDETGLIFVRSDLYKQYFD